jgi:hypothetical protein
MTEFNQHVRLNISDRAALRRGIMKAQASVATQNVPPVAG